jgi:Arc/MetJ-type ribon-helix-helix transcriptional regulator
MPEVEVTLPDRIESEIERLVDQGEFLNRERAVEELLSMGMGAYETADDTTGEVDEEMFTGTFEEQQDPAMRDEGADDTRTF